LFIQGAPLGTRGRFSGESSHLPGHLGSYTPATFRSGSRPSRSALTLNDDEKLVAYAKEIHRELRANEVRAEADSAPTRSKPKSPKPKKPKSTPCHRPAGFGCRPSKCAVAQQKVGRGAKPKGEVVVETLAAIKECRA